MKGNQDGLHPYLLDPFIEDGDAGYQVPDLRRHQTIEKSRGRIERREYYFSAAPRDSPILRRWPGVRSIGMNYRSPQEGDKLHEETMFAISSHLPKVKMLSRHIRGHWGIKIRQHGVLDVTFAEDAGRIRQGSSPDISAAFRRMALNIHQRDTTIRENIRGK